MLKIVGMTLLTGGPASITIVQWTFIDTLVAIRLGIQFRAKHCTQCTTYIIALDKVAYFPDAPAMHVFTSRILTALFHSLLAGFEPWLFGRDEVLLFQQLRRRQVAV